jgi:excinuclease UvrABC nuclease subunit
MIQKLKGEMKEAASHLEFERAAEIRDEIQRLEEMGLKMG